ncbi:MAG: TIGR00730 family Rossman fold protein [Bacteroidales bacterium]|nr:TIGR00730 family Rossman fold protein [Bacteroidales bacterium]
MKEQIDKKEEAKIRKAFKDKNWNEIKTYDSWQIFKVIAEFVEGFEKLSRIGPCVSIFGSAKAKPGSRYYKMAEEIAYLLTKKGFGVITGGGPGIMEAANKGAHFSGGKSVGLNINLPNEQTSNIFIDPDKLLEFDNFFVRKVMFMSFSKAFIALPGGFGTLDEFFELITLIQTKKINHFPVILIGKKYWAGLIRWMKNTVAAEQNIDPEDLSIFKLTDDPDEAVKYITDFYRDKKV